MRIIVLYAPVHQATVRCHLIQLLATLYLHALIIVSQRSAGHSDPVSRLSCWGLLQP